jgi:hypothetical protein
MGSPFSSAAARAGREVAWLETLKKVLEQTAPR